MVVTFVGADRPGLVDRLATVVASAGGNWEASRMERLAGRFAGIVEISVPLESATGLDRALQELGRGEGLTLALDRGTDTPPVGERHIHLEVTAADRPGIVRDLARVLALRGANIDQLETRCEGAPHSGEAMFQASMNVRIPHSLTAEVVIAALEELADELVIDLSVRV